MSSLQKPSFWNLRFENLKERGRRSDLESVKFLALGGQGLDSEIKSTDKKITASFAFLSIWTEINPL